MKHPSKDGKPQGPGGNHRRELADEETRILGANDGGAAPTSLATPAAPPAPPARDTTPLQADVHHTRILGYETLKADPVVGWLVVLEGPGKGNFRPVFRGSNTIGRAHGQRIPIDFGDDSISGEKQAFLTYDERKRSYQLVPNLERPNLVYHNDSALTSNVDLKPHDKIMMGRTTLLFVPLCGPDFDWGDFK